MIEFAPNSPLKSKKTIAVTRCGHVFHPACLWQWAENPVIPDHFQIATDQGSKCPLCRRKLDLIYLLELDEERNAPKRGNFIALIKSDLEGCWQRVELSYTHSPEEGSQRVWQDDSNEDQALMHSVPSNGKE